MQVSTNFEKKIQLNLEIQFKLNLKKKHLNFFKNSN